MRLCSVPMHQERPTCSQLREQNRRARPRQGRWLHPKMDLADEWDLSTPGAASSLGKRAKWRQPGKLRRNTLDRRLFGRRADEVNKP